MYPYYGGMTSTISFSTAPRAGEYFNVIYPYKTPNLDIRGNRHVDIDRLAELQKLIAKSPNRTDLKMELMELQKRFKPKIGKRKKKK